MDYTDIIKRLQINANDEEAVNELVNNYWAFGVKTARGALYNAGIFDQNIAEDMLQNSWIKVLRNIGNYNEKQQFAAWFATIIRNTCIDYARSAAVRHEQNMPQTQYDDEDYTSDVEIIDDTIYHQPEELYDQKARKEIIDDVLGHLKPEYRQIVTLRYVEGYTMREISEQLNLPMSTVEGRARIANAMVRDSVTEIQKRDDIKLYNLSPLPFFIWLLRDNEEPIKIPHKFVPKIMDEAGIKTSSAASGAAETIVNSSAKASASSATKSAGLSGFTKIFIGIAVAAASFGGGYAVLSQSGALDKADTVNAETNEKPADAETEKPVTENAPEEVKNVIWAVEPQFAFTGVKEMLPWFIPYGANDIRKEKTGYTEDWEYNATGERFGEFTGNAIEVMQGTHSGVYDYSGNELYPITLRKDVMRENARQESTIEYGYLRWVLQEDMYKMFTPDFKEVIQNDTAVWGMVPGPEERRIINGKIMSYNVYDNTSSETSYSDGTYCLMKEYNNDELIGNAIIDGNGNYVAHVQDDSNYNNWIVNKMIRVSNGQKYAFQSAVTGEMITDFIYEDAKYFMDGYAPVKRNLRWGYIDENGNEVTDIIFEDASMLYQGKAYVSVDGVYGIIDLTQTLQQGLAVTFESTRLPGDLAYQTDLKKSEFLSRIGTVKVNVSGLNARKGPSKEFPKVVPDGSVQINKLFDVYAIEEAEGFTWYEINDNMWIADDGTWLTYTERNDPPLHEFVGG